MKKYLIFLSIILLFSSCSIYKTVMNVTRLKFKVSNVDQFKVNGISIADKQKLTDFNAGEILGLTTKVASGQLPVSFTLNIEAKNPNDGSGGYPKTDITLKSFPFKLFLNNKETISGNISGPMTIPGKGENSLIPLTIEMNLIQFFKDKGLNEIIDLALNLGGVKKTTSQIKLTAKPLLGTPIGDLDYPGEITILDKEFN